MKFEIFTGIDISKATFDVQINKGLDPVEHICFENSREGAELFIQWLRANTDCSFEDIIVCMEHTGVYSYYLATMLLNKGLNIWIEAPLRIIRSIGLTRGKNDKVDSARIAEYAYRHIDKLKLWAPKSKELQKINYLLKSRDKWIKCKKSILVTAKEIKQFSDQETLNELIDEDLKLIQVFKQRIREIEKQIKQIIKNDPDLAHLFKVITSVPGVGFVVGTNIIVETNMFEDYTSAKAFACHAGIAPFEHSSGSSIKGRKRVSKMANKKLKSLLYMCVIGSLKYQNEFKEYFDRKMEEGKNKRLIINNIKNRIVHRVYTMVEM